MPTFQNFHELDEVGVAAAGGGLLGVIPDGRLLALPAERETSGAILERVPTAMQPAVCGDFKALGNALLMSLQERGANCIHQKDLSVICGTKWNSGFSRKGKEACLSQQCLPTHH